MSSSGGTSPQNEAGLQPGGLAAQKQQILLLYEKLGPMVMLIGVLAFFSIMARDSFPTYRNAETIMRHTTIVGIGALGMTMIIIMGGIDLSVGSMVALCTVVVAYLIRWGGENMLVSNPVLLPLGAAAAGILACGICGLFNGLCIIRLCHVPFIVTLGSLLIIRGAAKGLAGEQTINVSATWLKTLMGSLGEEHRYWIFPPGVWLMLFLALGVAFLLHYTRLGRYIFAIGSNEQTARLCGIPVLTVKLSVYVLGAICVGIGGLMQFSRLTVGDPTVAVGLELDIIAAVVIGGGSLAGGEGSILGTLVGALIMSSIHSGCSLMSIDNWKQDIITGIIIVTAVSLDQMRHRMSKTS